MSRLQLPARLPSLVPSAPRSSASLCLADSDVSPELAGLSELLLPRQPAASDGARLPPAQAEPAGEAHSTPWEEAATWRAFWHVAGLSSGPGAASVEQLDGYRLPGHTPVTRRAAPVLATVALAQQPAQQPLPPQRPMCQAPDKRGHAQHVPPAVAVQPPPPAATAAEPPWPAVAGRLPPAQQQPQPQQQPRGQPLHTLAACPVCGASFPRILDTEAINKHLDDCLVSMVADEDF